MSQNNVNIPSQPDHTLSNLNQSSKDFFLNDFSIASFKIHKEHLEDMEDFLETTRNPHNNKNPTKFMRSIPLTKLPPLLHKFKAAPKSMTRIAPYMGTVYDLKSKENNESNEPVTKTRAQINWSRLKKAIHIVRVQEKFKRTMTDRDKRISQGKTMSETEFEQHFSFFQNIIHKIKHGYINPQNHYLVLWKFLLQCSIICSSIAVPYRFAFGTDLNKPGPIRTLLILMDLSFAFDIILTFFIARLKTDGTLMTNRKTIAKVYIKGLFFIDTLTLLPYEIFYQKLVLLKLFRLLHLDNFFKTIKQIIEYVTFLLVKGLRATVIAHFLGSLLTTFVIILMIVNFFACMWISLGIPTNNSEQTWITITFENLDLEKDQGVIYVCSLYFMVQTIVSIGYGDTVGVTTREYLFCIAVLFFGVLGFAFMFGKIEAAINLYNDISLRQNKQKEDIETWMRRVEANIEEHLNCRGEMMMALVEAKLTQASSQDWQSSIGVNKHFKQLNPRMKSTILHFALRNLQKRFRTFFRGLSEDFIHEIMAESESRLFLASDIIMARGTRPEAVYLVLDGSVAVTGRTFAEVFRHLAPNSFFGDLAILNDRPISISFIAETEVSCLLIKREVFEKIEGKYPGDLARMKVLAHNRYRSFLNMKRNYEKLQVVRNSAPRKTYMAALQRAPENNNTIEMQDSNEQRFGTQAMALVSFIHTERPLVENERSNTSERRYERSPSIDQYMDPIDRLSSSRIRTHRRSSDSFKKHNNALFSDESDVESVDDSTDDDDDTAHVSKHPGREENSDSDSDLNYSDICPLEDIIPDFEDIGERYKMIDYLQGRVLFIKEKFKIMQKKIEADLQYIKRKTEINAKNLISMDVD